MQILDDHVVSFGRSGFDVSQEIQRSQLRLAPNTRIKVRFLLPCHFSFPFIHPPTSSLSLDGNVNLISLGEGRTTSMRRIHVLSCLSFILVQVRHLSALFFSEFLLVGGTTSFHVFVHSLRFAYSFPLFCFRSFDLSRF